MNGITEALITCRNLKRTYPTVASGDLPLELAFPDMVIGTGRRYALLGISGSGKSTFLNLIAGLDRPDQNAMHPAKIIYQFADGTKTDMADVGTRFPRERLGFVFQEGHLLSDVSAGINAGLPGLLNGISSGDDALKEYMSALLLPLDALGRETWRLSGGQKQRVALLRALFHSPQIIFADEPTSSLDRRTAEAIMRILVDYQEQNVNRTLFWATHDLALACEFATDFLVVRKPISGPIELETFGREGLDDIENKVYAGTNMQGIGRPLNLTTPSTAKKGAEIPYTAAKVGNSLTFAGRTSRYSLNQIGRIGRWMGSIEGSGPPVIRGMFEIRTFLPAFYRPRRRRGRGPVDFDARPRVPGLVDDERGARYGHVGSDQLPRCCASKRYRRERHGADTVAVNNHEQGSPFSERTGHLGCGQ